MTLKYGVILLSVEQSQYCIFTMFTQHHSDNPSDRPQDNATAATDAIDAVPPSTDLTLHDKKLADNFSLSYKDKDIF